MYGRFDRLLGWSYFLQAQELEKARKYKFFSAFVTLIQKESLCGFKTYFGADAGAVAV